MFIQAYTINHTILITAINYKYIWEKDITLQF